MDLVYLSLQAYINLAFPIIKWSYKTSVKAILFEKISGRIAIIVFLVSLILIFYACRDTYLF